MAVLAISFALAPATASADPLLTGVVEDVNAQTIEMPSLPGAWQRRIEWMAREGTQVEAGELVVRLDPGDLIAQEEQARTDLEKMRYTATRRINELRLAVMDAERRVAETESLVRMAELDAVIPAETIARLDYERYQLALETAQKDHVRALAELLNQREALVDVEAETALEVEQAQSNYERIQAALAATEIRAEKSGFIIYGANPFTGEKVFPGETLYSGFQVASIASREDLQVKFWVHEADILAMSSGQLLDVSADALSNVSFPARVAWTSNQAVERQDWSDGGYFEVIAEPLVGIPEAVMPGMSVMGRAQAEQPGRGGGAR